MRAVEDVSFLHCVFNSEDIKYQDGTGSHIGGKWIGWRQQVTITRGI